jgi:hypothetical protein
MKAMQKAQPVGYRGRLALVSSMRQAAYVGCLIALLNCGSFAGNPEEDDDGGEVPKAVVEIPDASRINLANLGTDISDAELRPQENDLASKLSLTSLALTGDANPKCGERDLGLFGLSINVACTLSPMASNLLYGDEPDRDGDGKITCDDYKQGKDNQGFLLSLLCEPALLKENAIKTARFKDDAATLAISFEAFRSTPKPVGTWSASGTDAGRYPANIRAWIGATGDTLQGVLGLALDGTQTGLNYFNLAPLGEPFMGEISFANPADASHCQEAPSKDTCFWQDIQILITDEERAIVGKSPSGVHLVILADNKERPSFIAIEGKYRYEDAVADKIVADSPANLALFKETREIYFRTIQANNQLWGSFDFKSRQGKTIAFEYTDPSGNKLNLPDLMRNGPKNAPYAGVCQDAKSTEISECTRIDYHDYASIWVGDDKLSRVESTYSQSIDFTSPPTVNGFVK